MMSSPAPAPLPARSGARWRIAVRILAATVLLALLATAGTAAWFYRAAQAALPQLDGDLAVAGLGQPVRVVRDGKGVPHITAQSFEDLFFAQGFVTAQDRLWQMDMSRRYAAGELSEVLGAGYLEIDKTQRTYQLRAAARLAIAALTPAERLHMESYAHGLNAYIRQAAERLPAEFRVLRYAPREWTVEDSLLVGMSMAQMLNDEWQVEYWRERISAKLTPEAIADLYPNSSWRDHPPGAPAPRFDDLKENFPPGFPPERPDGTRLLRPLPAAVADECDACVPGSNNWVVSGAHTASGRAMLANDMHLPHRIPNIWYEARLRLSDGARYDVGGVTLPGVPYVIVGRNRRIAWGFTNLSPDVQDLFIETFNAAGEYQTPSGWQKPEVRREIIRVKGKADVVHDVVVTRHGPIISGLLPGETRKLALQWTIHDAAFHGLPFFDMNSAGTWEQFRAAAARFGGPGQNMVYADVDGHIGYQATGRVPTRAAGDGSLPASGADDTHAWTGVLPFEHMPSVFDPPSGILATANSRITPQVQQPIATQWFSPYRTERIYRLLRSGKRFTAADMVALQNDVYSEFDHFLAGRIVYSLDRTRDATPRAREAADILRRWDGRMTASSAAPSIVTATRRQLWRLLLEPKLGQDYRRYSWGYSTVALENILLRRQQRWLQGRYASYEALLHAAVEQVVTEQAPNDLDSWKWSKRQPVEIAHPVFGAVPMLRRWAGPGVQPQDGGGLTVKQAGRTFGPSQRLVVDFGDAERFMLHIVNGQSGNIFSPHFNDQWTTWLGGGTQSFAWSDAALEAQKSHTLTLTPAR